MNTGLPRWTKWLIMLAFVGLFAGGSLYFIQSTVQTKVRTELEDRARQNNAVLTFKDVRYNLLKNVLTFEGTELKFTQFAQPLEYSFEQIDVINPNRSLAMAFAQQKLEDVRGVQPLAEAIDIRNMASGLPAETKVPMQRIEGLTLNVDVVRELLAKPNRTAVDTAVASVEAVGYKSRTANGMTVSATENGVTVQVSVGSVVEKDYANFALDSLVISDVVAKVQQGNAGGSLILKKMTMERMVLTRQIFEVALTGDPGSEENAIKILKGLLLGERPFIGALTFDDLQVIVPDLNIPLKSFRYENSSTSPFAVRLDLKGLTLPTAMVADGPALMLLKDLPSLTYNTSLNVLVPYKDPKALTKIASQSSIDKLGSLDLDMDGLIDFTQSAPEDAIDDFRLTRMRLAFTDDGLTPRAASMSKTFFGTDFTKLGEFGSDLLWNFVPKEERTPETRAIFDKVIVFMQKPGSIDITFAPPHPMTSDELEAADFGPETLQINVTTGPKTLEELVQALPK